MIDREIDYNVGVPFVSTTTWLAQTPPILQLVLTWCDYFLLTAFIIVYPSLKLLSGVTSICVSDHHFVLGHESIWYL